MKSWPDVAGGVSEAMTRLGDGVVDKKRAASLEPPFKLVYKLASLAALILRCPFSGGIDIE